MFRSIRFLSASFAARDYAGVGLLLLILAVATWTLSIIFSTATRDMAMKRFHLESDSFPLWAAHQAVPSMYNFENKIQFTNELLGDAPFDPADETYTKQTLNHFPARFVTFGDQLSTRFSQRRQGTFEMSSIYGDRELVTRWQIQQADSSNSPQANPNQAPMVIQRISQRWNSELKTLQHSKPSMPSGSDG